jgi:hypothetical protein
MEQKMPDREIINKFCYEFIAEMSSYCRKKYDLGYDWNIKTRLDYSESRKYNHGGIIYRNEDIIPYISLTLFILERYQPRCYREYSRFANCKEIGSVSTKNWQEYLRLLIAHEISHSVQFSIEHSGSKLIKWYKRQTSPKIQGLPKIEYAHGDFFQAIYRDLRKTFVNHRHQNNKLGITLEQDYYNPDDIN